MGTTPNPPGMRRVTLGGHPPVGYEILDGDQLIGWTVRWPENPGDRYWLAIPRGETPPRWFPANRHQKEAMVWLRDVD